MCYIHSCFASKNRFLGAHVGSNKSFRRRVGGWNKYNTKVFVFILGLRLIVEGEAACKWTESSGSGNNRRSTTYHGEQKYLNSITYLFGSKDCEIMEVPEGIHTYNFVCQLPTPIPYSVEGKFGHVRYKVDANLDIPWAFDLQSERGFTVVRHEDLNIFPELRLPIEVEEIKVFCCLFCKSDPLIVKVRLPRTGFGLGEKIPVCVELINNSNKDVEKTTFSLKRVDRFHSTSPFDKTKETKEEVAESRGRGAKKGETVTFEELVEIPHTLMINNNKYCNVFQITYELKVTAETEGISVSPELYMPVTIGSVALRCDGFESIALKADLREKNLHYILKNHS